MYFYWATVCKCYRTVVCPSVCLSCPVCLCVTLVYCGQTVGWIKMKLGMQVGLGPGHIVFDGEPAPPRKERGTAAATFEIYGRRFCLRSYNPQPTSIVAKRLKGS